MTEEQQIREYIRACEHMLAFFRSYLVRKPQADGDSGSPSSLSELTELRMLAKSDKWTPAYEAGLSDEARALKFLSSVSIPLKDKNVLDFGSCDGALSQLCAVRLRAKQVVSYDVNLCRHNSLSDPSVINTDNLKLVQQMAPYEIILANDVLDHMSNPTHWLQALRGVLKEADGRAFVRCHPYTSRNGAHIGEQINRSHLHLVFTDEELATFGVSGKFTQRITDPHNTYRTMFEESGFKIVREREQRHPLDISLMADKRVSDRIKKSLGLEGGVVDLIEIDHIDYELSC